MVFIKMNFKMNFKLNFKMNFKMNFKGLTMDQVRSTGCKIMLSNTYHLGLRPGKCLCSTRGAPPGLLHQGPLHDSDSRN